MRVTRISPIASTHGPLTARASWSTLPSHSWLALPRSISSSEKNHGLRFEGILKFDLQGNRPSKAKNRQIR